MIEIRAASRDEIRASFGFVPQGLRDSWIAFDGEAQLGLCGVLRDPAYYGTILEDEGRWIAFLNLAEGLAPAAGVRLVMAIARYLRAHGEDLWVYCDHHKFPTAERLLGVVGFTPTSEIRANWRDPSQKVRMWQWRE